MKNIAIIPARSGSKRLKDKNIRLLNGKPLITYSIEAALESDIFDEVMVSTDSEHYADIANTYGAKVPFLRSENTSTDNASSWDMVNEVLNNYDRIYQKKFDMFTLLQPTSPLRNALDIKESYRLFVKRNANAVISVCQAEHSPLWCNTLQEDLSMIKFAETDNVSRNRQQQKTYYRLNGAIYMLSTSTLSRIDQLYAIKCYAYIMDQRRSVDIDNEIDFILAETLLKI